MLYLEHYTILFMWDHGNRVGETEWGDARSRFSALTSSYLQVESEAIASAEAITIIDAGYSLEVNNGSLHMSFAQTEASLV